MRWRDIRTGLTVATAAAFEPVSRAEAKLHCRIDHADEDHLIDGFIPAARRQLVKDTGFVPVNEVYDLAIERFPEERFIPVPRLPLASVASIKSYDEDDVESTFASSNYRVDTATGRIVLNDDATWPSDLRRHNAGVIRFTAGPNGTPFTISAIAVSGTAPNVIATATAAAHGRATGDRVAVVGSDQDALNGTFGLTVTSASEFTYPVVSGSPSAHATGTVTGRLLNLPETHRLAMLLLIEHFWRNRGATVEQAASELPLGYCALIGGADRVYAMA